MVVETHMKLCVTEPDFLETIFLSQIFDKNWSKMVQKQGFLNLSKNLVIIFTEFIL